MGLFWILFIIPGVYLAAVWHRLPEKVPMHYNFKGEVDRYGSRTELLWMVILLSALNVGIYLLMLNIHRIDPKRYGASNMNRMKRLGHVIVVFMVSLLCYIIYTSVEGTESMSSRAIFAGVGILFCFIGNYMFNIKPNYFAGFRLPWALENEENWRLTHNLAGKLWFAGGLLIALLVFLLPTDIFMILFFILVGLMVIIPTIYSYNLFRKQRTSKN